MSGGADEALGPPMICAYDVVKPPPSRVGTVMGRALPVAVTYQDLYGLIPGAILAPMIGFAVTQRASIFSFVILAGLGGAIGSMIMRARPRDESIWKWIQLELGMRKRKRYYFEGRPVAMAIGVCLLDDVVLGPVQLNSKWVHVAEGAVDDRGVRRTERNRNLTDKLDEDAKTERRMRLLRSELARACAQLKEDAQMSSLHEL